MMGEFTHPINLSFKLDYTYKLDIFMSPEPDELNMLVSQYRSMDIEALKANIDQLEGTTDCSHQLRRLDIAKNELELKFTERQKQIELLTKSLTSSSRFRRWISSAKSVLKQFLEFKN